MNNREKINRLHELLSEAEVYERAVGKLNFDMMCCAPEDGMDKAGDDMAYLEKKYDEIVHSEEFCALVCELHTDSKELSYCEKKCVDQLYDDYLKTKNLTPEMLYEMNLAQNKAYSAWLTAKKTGDFSVFRDSFASVVDYTRKAFDLRDNKKVQYYDNCLDDYEKGGNTAQMDEFFGKLSERIIPLIAQIKEKGKSIRTDFLSRPCPISLQENFSRYLLEIEGLKKSALVLMTTEHPFTENFGKDDVRVTTHYYEENFISNIFSTLHEGGHALFMQNEPEEFYENHIDDHMTSAMHECISRFYENIVGRSEAFIEYIYPKLREICGDTFSDVTVRELYEAVNAVTPGLIRMESDELCYSVHIMIRYEIEKLFINGDISVDDIPALWNRKYKEYLGVDVPNDSSGCLQDVHWTDSYGYFPSYALGNAYGAQILKTMEKDIDVFGEIRKGNLNVIGKWLKTNVFSTASVSTPDEWIKKITGDSLNVDYYLDYLEEKFKKIYQL